jgi:hypothetical protein
MIAAAAVVVAVVAAGQTWFDTRPTAVVAEVR